MERCFPALRPCQTASYRRRRAILRLVIVLMKNLCWEEEVNLEVEKIFLEIDEVERRKRALNSMYFEG